MSEPSLAPKKYIVCVPADPELIYAINANLGSKLAWKPTIEHTWMTCPKCGRGMWIGPNQLQVHKSVFIATELMCGICHAYRSAALRDVGIEVEENFVATNMEIDQVPPRF